ncbi:MAG: PAS domain-containing protein [Gemmatimonadaceae bacterium]
MLDPRALFAGSGETRALCLVHDWTGSLLGPVKGWPESLRTIAATVLGSGFPMIVLWGPDLIQIYNDAYIPFLGTKHPSGLGRPTRECWPEAWAFNEPIYARVSRGETVNLEDQLYQLLRHGPDEPPDDVYITLSYSPVRDESGEVGGVLVTLLDTTHRVTANALEKDRDALRDTLLLRLEAERAQLIELFRLAPAFLAMLKGPKHVIEAANDAFCRFVGRSDIVGKTVAEAVPEARQQGIIQLLDGVLNTGVAFVGREFPAWVQPAADEPARQYFLDFVYEAVVGADGARTGVLVHGSDVTEHVLARRAVEAANAQLQEQSLELELANQQLQVNALELAMQTDELRSASEELLTRTVAAEAAEQQLQTVFAQAPALVSVTMGSEHRFVMMNARAEAVSGKGNVIGRTLGEAFPELASQGFIELLDRVYSTGEPYAANEVAATLTHADGTLHTSWFDLVYQPLRDASGTVTGILQHTVEVTERVQAREEAAEREQQFRTLADAIPALAWTARPDGYIDWYNARWYEYTGTTPRQLEGWGWQSVHDPVTLPAVLEQWRSCIAEGSQFELTFPLKGSNGEFRNFLTRVVPLRDSHGTVARWFGTNTDVEAEHSARLAAESARVEAETREAKYRTLTELLPVQVWTATPDGLLDYVGEQTSKYFGTPAADLLRTGWIRFVHPDDTDRAARRWATSLATGAPYETEFRLMRSDGDYRWHIARAGATRSASGEITGWVGTNTDVEGERRARSEAEEAGRAAETANRAKSDFLAIMSHELRTPLNAIGGYTELLSMGIRGPVTEAQTEDLARITRSQQHLLGLINDLLNLARLDAGQVSYDITDVPVSAAIWRVEELILPQLTAKGLTYENVECDPTLVVRADSDKLRQVLVNLLSNATKYTDTGSVTVRCDAMKEAVRIHVSDTGRGIASDQLGRIFEPFVQLTGASHRPREGVGLGLAISRDLARGMGGELTAESTTGAGSTFTLTLPRPSRDDGPDA